MSKMKYHQIDFSLDEKIIGKNEMPHTISIESKEFQKYISSRAKNISAYFENKDGLYENMPEPLCGKLIKRKNAIDFMDFTPACLSLVAVISGKIKEIFEKLQVSKKEYVLKEISIKGYAEPFYLLFLPIISDKEFVYSGCIFEEMFDEGNTKIFSNREEYYNDTNYYLLKKVTLGKAYKDYDLLYYPQGSGYFFSERIINAFQKENIVGYEIITGGCFYEEIEFLKQNNIDEKCPNLSVYKK